MSESEFRDEARSWPQLIAAWVRRRARALYAVAAAMFGLFLALSVLMVIHIEVTTVGLIARAEVAGGVDYATTVSLPGLYVNLVLYGLAFAASLWSLLSHTSAEGGDE